MEATQTLARHSDPKLTLNTYSHLDLSDGRAAVERPTGTFGASEDRQRTLRAGALSQAAERGIADDSAGEWKTGNPLSFGVLRGEKLPETPGVPQSESAPRRTRTFDPLIKSQIWETPRRTKNGE